MEALSGTLIEQEDEGLSRKEDVDYHWKLLRGRPSFILLLL